jgi:hypothetical protein
VPKHPTRIGLISDTHGLLREEALEALRGSELILHAGDVGKAEILEALRKLAPVVAVRGNVDTQEWARALPVTSIAEAGALRIYMLHSGLPDCGQRTFAPARQDRAWWGLVHQSGQCGTTQVSAAGDDSVAKCWGRTVAPGVCGSPAQQLRKTRHA